MIQCGEFKFFFFFFELNFTKSNIQFLQPGMIHRISNISYHSISKCSFLSKANRNKSVNKFSKVSIKPLSSLYNKRFITLLRKNKTTGCYSFRKYHTSSTKLTDSNEEHSSEALPIFELSPETFRDELTSSEIPLIVEFYLPEYVIIKLIFFN